MRLFSWILALCLLSGLPPTYAASFDCAKAQTRVEQLVCTHPTLSRLDDMLAVAYSEAQQAPDAAPDLLQQQRLWLRQRATCQSTACLETAYERRLIELEFQEICLKDLATGGCASSHQARPRLPRTADGRLMLLTRPECRIGFDGGVKTKNQAEAIQIHADCIEADVYDPCDDAGGKWGEAQCVWAHLEVSKRRISKAESDIRLLLRGNDRAAGVSGAVEQSAKRWQTQTDGICADRNSRWPPAESAAQDAESFGVSEPPTTPEGEAEPLGYCLKRVAAERADEMANWASRLKNERGSAPSVQALLRFLSDRK